MTTFKCIESLEENPVDVFLQVTEILLKLIDNVLLYPSDPKYRKLRLGNKLVSTVIMPSIGAMECLFEIGFQEGDDALLLPPEKTSVEKLSYFRKELSNRRSKHLKTSSTCEKSNKNESIREKEQTTTNLGAPSQPGPSPTPKQPEAHTQPKSTIIPKQSEMSMKPVSTCISHSSNSFLVNLQTISAMVLQYEEKVTKDKVLSVVPLSEISERAQRRIREHQQQALKSSEPINEINLQESIFLAELLNWFKNDFFEWVDKPKCHRCKSDTKFLEMSLNPQETTESDRVEVYICDNCSARVLFPRINSAVALMSTRKGRCGEWANAFTAVCRALDFEARLVNDVSDHVWTEVYFKSEGRWVHCDPCECVFDKPLLYEKGWSKNLSYVIAFSCEEVQDVTWRYSADHKAVLARRNKCTEEQLIQTINELNQLRQVNLTTNRRKMLARRRLMELVQLMQPAQDQDGDDEGRKSGSLSWRLSRLETSLPHESVSHVWKPTTHEVNSKKMNISYCTATDEYILSNGKRLKGWNSGVFLAEYVFRKEEKDWKTAYICRTNLSVEGRIQWQVDLKESGMQVDHVEVRCPVTTFKSGKVVWLLCGGDICSRINKGELSSSEFRGSKSLSLSVTLSGGEGDVAWQHAQIFRQQLDALEPVFQLSISLIKSS